jgi:dTDP-4-dehydrorhamnose reductase
MRVLILGAAGMFGHKLWQVLRDCRAPFDTWASVRGRVADYERYTLFDQSHLLGGVEADNFDSVIRAFATVRPEVVINCIGVIKQLPTAKNPTVSLKINALFPHQLATLCQTCGARLFHMSTDCVFSGRKGCYSEDDVADADDLYGRTKYLGEVGEAGCLTLRTSIIGRELSTTSGLVEWFLSNRGHTVRGYSKAIFSGFTTLALAQIIIALITDHPGLSGLYHVASEPINKYDLLCLIRDTLALPIEIEPDGAVQIDRSLDGARFREATGLQSPLWQDMIRAMAADPTPYDTWRTQL